MDTVIGLVKLALNLSLALTVFAYAMRAQRGDFLFFRQEPRLLLISLLSIFVLAPTVAIAVAEWIEPPLVVRVAIATLSISIIPPLLPLKQLSAGGDRRYAVGLTLIVAALAIVVVPLQADLLNRISNHSYGIPLGEFVGYVGLIIMLPTVLGVLSAWLRPGLAQRVSTPLARVAGAVTMATMLVILAVALPDFPRLFELRSILAILLFNLAALGVGYLLGGPQRDRAVVLGLSTSSRHPALALTVAAVNFPEEKFSAAVMLCVAVNMAVTALFIRWHVRQAKASLAASAT